MSKPTRYIQQEMLNCYLYVTPISRDTRNDRASNRWPKRCVWANFFNQIVPTAARTSMRALSALMALRSTRTGGDGGRKH